MLEGPEDELEAQLTELEPEPTMKKPQQQNSGDKTIEFMFKAGNSWYTKDWKVNRFNKLPREVKMLMAIGQINAPQYSCFRTEEERMRWVLRMVNKGKDVEIEELSTTDELQEMLEESIINGYASQNGNGPQITEKGIDYLNTFKKLQLVNV